jgi:hypothetical protein
MIDKATEIKNPQVEGGSILILELTREPEESPEEFAYRIDRLGAGVHQMEFTKSKKQGVWTLKIELNPQWQVGEEKSLQDIPEAELLAEFHATTAGAVKNKIDYDEG